ncbi:RrF2 family transcriptional regulator [Streptomyces spiralis]
MKMGEGVEWGLHCCLMLGWLQEKAPVPLHKLATWFDLPQEYLKKRLQPLVRAGILASMPGAKGGYLLARQPDRITLMDVVTALEGPLEAFRCAEIRQRGVSGEDARERFAVPCGIATAMSRAELAWRRELAAQTIADLMAHSPDAGSRIHHHFT